MFLSLTGVRTENCSLCAKTENEVYILSSFVKARHKRSLSRVLPLVCKWKNWGTEWLCDLPVATKYIWEESSSDLSLCFSCYLMQSLNSQLTGDTCIPLYSSLPFSNAPVCSRNWGLYINWMITQSSQLQSFIQSSYNIQCIMALWGKKQKIRHKHNLKWGNGENKYWHRQTCAGQSFYTQTPGLWMFIP